VPKPSLTGGRTRRALSVGRDVASVAHDLGAVLYVPGGWRRSRSRLPYLRGVFVAAMYLGRLELLLALVLATQTEHA
jgi:hypothetical protein